MFRNITQHLKWTIISKSAITVIKNEMLKMMVSKAYCQVLDSE